MARLKSRLDSSFVSWATYDTNTRIMGLTLRGENYDHSDVDRSTYDALVSAPSAGAYYNANIKGRFRTTSGGTTVA